MVAVARASALVDACAALGHVTAEGQAMIVESLSAATVTLLRYVHDSLRKGIYLDKSLAPLASAQEAIWDWLCLVGGRALDPEDDGHASMEASR